MRTGSVNVERGSLSDLNIDFDKQKRISRMASEDSFCSNDSRGHWMAESRGRTVTVINTFEDEDISKYLKRKLAGVVQSDNMSSHPSSVCAEDGSDADPSDLISMQDVLEFADDDQSYLSDLDDNDLKDIDDASEIGLGESAIDYETIDISDGIVEPMSVSKKPRSLAFDTSPELSSGNSSAYHKLDDNICEAAKVIKRFSHTDESLPTDSNTEPRPLQKRRYPPLGVQKDVSNYFTERDSPLLVDNGNIGLAVSRRGDTFISGKIDKSKPLFQLEGSDSGDSLPGSKEEGSEKGKIDMNVNDYESLERERKAVNEEKGVKRTDFTDGKTFGHRRLQSAPVMYTPKKENTESNVEHGLPGSPFEMLKHTPVFDQIPGRVRSYSQGNAFVDGQEELTKIAERICQIDRKDLEMDDPEEIQVFFI